MPTSRSRFAQPSSRRPIPGANESSTVEWHKAQVTPMERSAPPPSNRPFTPTTASRLSRVREIHRALLDLLDERSRQGIAVHLQTEGEGCLRAQAGADASVLVAGDRAMELERIAPERLAPKRVGAERAAAFFDHPPGVVQRAVRRRGRGARGGRDGGGPRRGHSAAGHRQDNREPKKRDKESGQGALLMRKLSRLRSGGRRDIA